MLLEGLLIWILVNGRLFSLKKNPFKTKAYNKIGWTSNILGVLITDKTFYVFNFVLLGFLLLLLHQ
jgi:hypothetical protein